MGYDVGPRRRHLRRAHRPGGRPVPARGRAHPRRLLRPADHERAAPARPQGGRRPPAVAARGRRRSGSPGRPGRQDASSSTRATAARRPRRASCPTARCAGPRPTWPSTWPPGWRAGSPPPACGCTSPAGPSPAQPLTGRRPGRARQRPRRRPAHLAAPRRPPQPGRRRASRPTTTAPATGVTSTVGERLAGLVQREIVARTGLRDCRTHAKTWELLRLTRMPAVRVDVGYLTSPADRARLIDPRVPGPGGRGDRGRRAADVLPGRAGRADRLDRRAASCAPWSPAGTAVD